MTEALYCLDVAGPRACYTSPDTKVERVSYPVPTGSVIRAIFEAVLWKPAIRWAPTRIDVLTPVRAFSERRSEVTDKALVRGMAAAATRGLTPPMLIANEKRVQRTTQYLRDVHYRLYARMVMVADDAPSNPGKYRAMFERRAAAGQCVNQPWLGLRECAASFTPVPLLDGRPSGAVVAPIDWTEDLGVMLRDWDYSVTPPRPIFAPTRVVHGVVDLAGEVLP